MLFLELTTGIDLKRLHVIDYFTHAARRAIVNFARIVAGARQPLEMPLHASIKARQRFLMINPFKIRINYLFFFGVGAARKDS